MVTKLTRFELLFLLGQPFVTYHLARVRKDVRALVSKYPSPVRLLDIGARKSHYTIGLAAEIYLLDVPRETEVQRQLGLGVTDETLTQLQKRRSNVRGYWVQDFLRADLPAEGFEIVTAIEVFEHIREPSLFVEKVCQALTLGGVFYMTTPNGSAVSNRNPDHFHHYTSDELESQLSEYFAEVQVMHGEIMTTCWRSGLGFWKPSRPAATMTSLVANFINRLENRLMRPKDLNAARLFASALKAIDG